MTISIATMYEALMTRLLSMDPSSVEARRLYVKAFYPGRHKAHGWGFLPRRLLTVGGGARVAKPGVTVHETTPVARRARFNPWRARQAPSYPLAPGGPVCLAGGLPRSNSQQLGIWSYRCG